MTALRTRYDESVALIASCRDVLDDRPAEALAQENAETPVVSPALQRRGWHDALLALSDDAVDALESGGLAAPWPPHVSPALTALVGRARALCDLPAFTAATSPPRARRHETPRKQRQVDALLALLAPLLPRVRRVIDVGSGHGHMTRAIAAGMNRGDVQVIGLDRDTALVDRARALAATHGVAQAITFARADVVQEGIALGATDGVIGLHACGELGDALVAEAARAGASAVLIGCCLQKRRATERTPFVENGPTLARDRLGLSNLTLRDEGVEASRADNLAARARRLALLRLLRDAGIRVALGAEMSGLNRRAAQQDLTVLVQRAFALRGLSVPDLGEIQAAAAWADTQHARLRRFQLPRAMLARALEVHVLLDRAVFLQQHGHDVEVGRAFDADVSARNLALVARAPPTSL